MRFRTTVLTVATLVFSATFAGSAVAVPNVVDQYTEQLPSATGPSTTPPKRPDRPQNSDPATGTAPDPGAVDLPLAAEAPVSPGAGPDAPKPKGKDAGKLSRENSSGDPDYSGDPDSNRARNRQDPADAQPAAETETGGIGSGMGIVFPAILLLATAAAFVSLFARRGASRQTGQD